MGNRHPTYDLQRIQALVREQRYRVTITAQRTAADLGIPRAGIERCMGELTLADFYKTMPAERRAGLWQDVYRPRYAGLRLYVKLQINAAGTARW